MLQIDIIVGARPNFVKIAPILKAIQGRQAQGAALAYRLIHTGQHQGPDMSDNFFKVLKISNPEIFLHAGNGNTAQQSAQIMLAYDAVLAEKKADLCLVVGDVTSTMACAITAKKRNLKIAHVEAGLRCYDASMPEEINRVLTDAISDYCFSSLKSANQNLKKEGHAPDRIFWVGNTLIDTLKHNLRRLKKPAIWSSAGLQAKEYFVLTLHRPSNVDDPEKLRSLIQSLGKNTRQLPVIFPIHPRTKAVLSTHGIEVPEHFHATTPMNYLEFMFLLKNARCVITDSGGISEESSALNIPCMTLRTHTERPETVELGTNELLGDNPAEYAPAFEKLFSGQWKKGRKIKFWDGKTAERIVAHLEALHLSKKNI